MADFTLVQTNFTAGEVSPRMLGRVDVERYKNGAQEIYNCLPLIHGGCKSTQMLRYNGDAKNADRVCRLIRFEFSKTEANILEFGHQYIRFWNQDRSQVMDSGSPYEITTVYDETELFEIEYIGGADTIFLFHESHPIQRLRRFGDTNWVIDEAPFDPAPFTEQGHTISETLTLSAATVGTGRTFTAGAAAFLEADVGRRIVANGGVALITGYTSTTVVTCTIETAFEATSFAADAWTITGTPQAVLTPSANGTVGESITLELATGTIYGDRLSINDNAYDSGASSPPTFDFQTTLTHGFSVTDIVQIEGMLPEAWNGTYEVVALANYLSGGDDFQVNGAPDPGAYTRLGTVRQVTASASVDGFRSVDVGSFININGGLIEITGVTSASQIDGTIRQAMTSDVGAQAGAWVLKQSVWNSTNGYPRCGCFFQQRLVVGGSPAFPHTIALSRVGEYLTFELGLLDDDAFMYTLDATEFDPILHLIKIKSNIVALTSGKEFTLTGGIEAPITPSNVQVGDPTDFGCNDVRPARVANELVFVNRTGKKMRALGYRFEADTFTSPDLTKLSEHITGDGLSDMTYQQEPESIIWALRADGALVTLSIDRDEGVVAWARQLTATGHAFESVEAIPNDNGVDEVWVSVKRVINGSTVRTIESFDVEAPYGLESAISGTDGSGVTTITGLDHLEGETVDVVADGVILDQEVVASGQITIERAALAWFVGLPRRGYIKTLNPEVITQLGSAQGNNIRIANTTLRMLESTCADINGQYVDFRTFGSGLLDQAPPTFTGDIDVSNLGWYVNAFNTIAQPNALPFHVLAVIMKLEANQS